MEITITHILIILELIILEGLLSFDNALALAALVRKKLKDPIQQQRALVYGIWGAYILRIGIIFVGVWLMKYEWVKAIAGFYLLYLAIHELFLHKTQQSLTEDNNQSASQMTSLKVSAKTFFIVVAQVELMDLMFSIDSIAVALAISDIKWVLITGAVLGVLFMRIAAGLFIRLIENFPALEKTAFVLVGLAGLNVILKLKDLNLGFMYLTIDKPIPENIFLGLIVGILVFAIVFSKIFSKKLAK
ncbi:TerC family protein [Spirobacillus cienkowskii]|uniref:TerC family protein n=1 Tax=Spirobacillus cienkowskii TaxID=495820 RepID=UPI0030CFAE9E